MKLTNVEYFVCLATFALIQMTSVEYGIILGVLVHYICRKLGLNVGENKALANEQEEETEPIEEVQRFDPKAHMVDPKTLEAPKVHYGATA